MNKKIISLVVIYTILNLLIVIFPQIEKNQDLKQQFSDENKLKSESAENISQITDVELIREIDDFLRSSNLDKINYTYSKDKLETTQAHQISMRVNGSKSSITNFIKQLPQIEGLQLNELLITKDKGQLDANIDIVVIGAKNEKKTE